MKFLLTSNGLTSRKLGRAFVGLLEKKVEESRVLVVHTAQKPEHMAFVDGAGKEMSKRGILLPNITYMNIAEEKSSPSLQGYDAVYICGGNTYFILDRIRKTGLATALREFARTNGLYIGVSAGSIIVGRDITIAGFGSEGDPNEIGLKDLKGLEFLDLGVFPHYRNKLKKEVDDFRRSVDYHVETLKDGHALLINNAYTKRI